MLDPRSFAWIFRNTCLSIGPTRPAAGRTVVRLVKGTALCLLSSISHSLPPVNPESWGGLADSGAPLQIRTADLLILSTAARARLSDTQSLQKETDEFVRISLRKFSFFRLFGCHEVCHEFGSFGVQMGKRPSQDVQCFPNQLDPHVRLEFRHQVLEIAGIVFQPVVNA